MPVTTIGSYVTTMRDFRLHWTSVNTVLGVNPLLLPVGYTLSDFIDDEEQVNNALTNVTQTAALARTSTAQLLLLKAPLRERVTQFRLSLELHLSTTRFAGRAPAAPTLGETEDKFLKPLDTIEGLWSQINAATDLAPFVGPLTLQGGYTLAQLSAALVDLRAAFYADGGAQRSLDDARANRNALLKPIYNRMKQYRTAVRLALPVGSPLLQTVPRLSPPPGTTPPAVTVSGAWDNPLGKARLTWPASTAPHLDKLQVRACTGGTYKVADEEIVADLPADATHYETDWALTAPGAIASFKVYVMTTTGNENGSKAVKIVRPVT